jgi:uncharacterized protein YegP (UPF0339 family)
MSMSMRMWSVGLGALLALLAGAVGGERLASAQNRTGKAAKAKPAGQLKFEIYQDKANKYRWRLKAANGEILATSGEGYKSKESCKHGLASVQKGAGTGKLKFDSYKDKAGEYRWRLKASNGQIVAASSQGYKSKRDCEHAVDLIKNGAAKAKVEAKK